MRFFIRLWGIWDDYKIFSDFKYDSHKRIVRDTGSDKQAVRQKLTDIIS